MKTLYYLTIISIGVVLSIPFTIARIAYEQSIADCEKMFKFLQDRNKSSK